jgi:hypothetical protein
MEAARGPLGGQAAMSSNSSRKKEHPLVLKPDMSIRRLRPPGRLARRAMTYLCVPALLGLGMVAAGQPPEAAACSISSHCYAFAVANGPANGGGSGALADNCLYVPDNGNFVTQEMWDGNTNTLDYWTEVGLISGIGSDGTYYSHHWFWADNRPNGGGYHFHAVAGTASGGPLGVETTYVGNNEWYIYGGNSFTQIGTSTGQPETSSGYSEWGTEYTTTAGLRDLGTIYNLDWEGTNGEWHAEGGLAHAAYGGSGPYVVTPSYNSSESALSLSGPC